MAAPTPGERVLDCCAAPGGKTTAMAAAMGDAGLIVAGDVRPRRLDLLRKTVALSGASRVRLVRFDVRRPLPVRSASFDLVLLDAPCSGLGTIRRDPEIRWRREEGDLAPLAAAQRGMIEHAAEAVRPGGRLVYATCSSEPDENEDVVAGFLDSHRSFALGHPGRGETPAVLRRVLDEQGMLRTSPAGHGLEAFFAAVLRRGLG
jgi:16S rRNA (cytosine967-C5)-methyltransferase